MVLIALAGLALPSCGEFGPGDTHQSGPAGDPTFGEVTQDLTTGAWTTGTMKTAVAGSDRMLVVTVHTESAATIDDLSGVTYGGQAMTEVEDEGVSSGGFSAYTAIYILRETGIVAATHSTIALTWALGPVRTPTVNSAFFTGVDQAAPVGAARTAAATVATVSTLSVPTTPGDLVIFAATNGQTVATFAPANGFAEQLDAASADYRYHVAQKAATGTSETPSTVVTSGNRTAMVAFTLKAATSTCTPTTPCGGAMECGVDSCGNSCGSCSGGEVCSGNACTTSGGGSGSATLLGSWTAGATHTAPAGTRRALVVTVHSESAATIDDVSGVTYGGQAMTEVEDEGVASGGYSAYAAVYILKESGIAAATHSTIALTWAVGPGRPPTVGSAFFTGVDQAAPVGPARTVATTAATVSTLSVTTSPGDVVIFSATNGQTAASFAPAGGFAEQLDAASADYRYHVAQKAVTGSSETPTTVVSGGNRTAMVAFALKAALSTEPPPPAPTCTDGVKNGSETGVDCGGPCIACVATNVTVFSTASGQQAIQFAATEVVSALSGSAGYGANPNKTLAQLGAATDPVRIAVGKLTDTALTDELSASGGTPVTGLLAEGYAIRYTLSGGQETYYVIGNDDSGAMYGALDIAERIRVTGLVANTNSLHNPHYEKRALKMNIPLDARTPSYADGGDAAQAGIEDVWDINFWKEHFDEMARNRFNAVSLWALNPFPTLVKDVPGFEDVDIDGPVKKLNLSTFDLRAWRCSNGSSVPCLMTQSGDQYDNSGKTMWSPSTMSTKLQNLALGNAAPDTMNEKVQYWQDVMQYAKDRGVAVYMLDWNIFPTWAGGQYGMTDSRTDATTKAYYKAAVKKLLDTYPNLAGFGWSSGENMSGTASEKGQWITDTIGQGIKDHLVTNPSRSFTAICRSWMGSMPEIKSKFSGLGLTSANYPNFRLDFSFKYAAARLYSRTAHVLHRDQSFAPTDNTWWELRNDDIFMVRWADPDFVRSYMENFPRSGLGGPTTNTDPKTRGYHMGADGFFFSRDFNSVDPTLRGQLQAKKRWAEYYLWGQMGYNPSLTTEHFKSVMRQRYQPHLSAAQSDQLFTLWVKSSQVIPKINSYRWIDWDFQFNPETNGSKATGFHKVNNAVSWTYSNASATVSALNGIKTDIDAAILSIPTPTPELRYLVGDIQAMGHLAAYYADKIEAGVDFGSNKAAAAVHLEDARVHFGAYRDVLKPQYGAQHILGRAGFWSLDEIYTHHTCYDIKAANTSKSCP
jgi:hypothetical protein